MINVVFLKDVESQLLIGFNVAGHAFFSDSGKDIVCASVTSAVQLTANAITECLKSTSAKIHLVGNSIDLKLDRSVDISKEVVFIDALYLHLNLIESSYPKNIKVTVEEV